MRITIKVFLGVLLTFLLCLVFVACGDENTTGESSDYLYIPWENGGKSPSEYTWQEFEALEGYLQIEFQNTFDSVDDFDKWLQMVNPVESEDEVQITLPWENGGKKPSEYTWEEFEALEGYLQIEFQKNFESVEEFNEWFQRVNPQ